jgi:hypothetical protein
MFFRSLDWLFVGLHIKNHSQRKESQLFIRTHNETLPAVAPTARTSGGRSKFDAFVHEIGDTIETGKLLVVAPIELLGGK